MPCSPGALCHWWEKDTGPGRGRCSDGGLLCWRFIGRSQSSCTPVLRGTHYQLPACSSILLNCSLGDADFGEERSVSDDTTTAQCTARQGRDSAVVSASGAHSPFATASSPLSPRVWGWTRGDADGRVPPACL